VDVVETPSRTFAHRTRHLLDTVAMKPFSEAVRERDLQRYYQPWLDAQSLVNAADGRAKGLTYEGYEAKASRDKVLTAFAQLAALRLDVRRCMVSLIDSSRQYILAEATRTLSLQSESAEVEADDLWLGHTILKRDDAVCHHTFDSTYTAIEQDGRPYTANCLVIPDCREDERFSKRDYVVSEPGVRFYAGVPITTKAGHIIGVYAVSDERPRDGLRAAEVKFMQDVSVAVMEHLELAKDSDARVAGERMVRGLTEFIERSSAQETRGSSNHRPTTLEKQTENARLQAIADEEPASAIATPKQPQRKREPDRESDASRIFQRAARIMRQSTHADGVVFFDSSAASLSTHASPMSSSASSDESQYSSTTAGSTTASKKRRRDKGALIAANGTVDADANLSPAESKPCPIAGLSLRTGCTAINEADFVFTEASMERYINRYPQGKYFNFDSDGSGFNSSDERSEKSDPEHSEHADKITPLPNNASRYRKKRDSRFIPTELIKVLPNIRSLIFLPLWDASSERWTAGGFIWTAAAGRLLNPDHELPYLKAFGNSITSELVRYNAQKSDRAKTTFIASISHELRSPLHGILGSVEFLRDTVSSGYQQSLVSSIETCGKTLLDTIDHVLDYAKINKLRNANARKKSRADGRKLPADNSILGVTTAFNLGQLVEEVCDTVCAGHTFRKTHDSHNVSIYDQGNNANIEVAGQIISKDEADSGKDRVVVTLNVDPSVNWNVRTQPGALRRVVM
jgi:signal transduction histidine kinase/GAF domain-containing protein